MTSYGRSSAWDAFNRLSVLTAFAMSVFAIAGLVMTGLASTIIDVMETHQFLPFAISMLALATVFASSNTRDPRYYHPAEWAYVGVVMAFMAAHAFLTEVQDLVMNNSPWAGAAVVILMVVASAVVGR